jgi:2-enoate reductase
MKGQYEALFTPMKVGGITLKNRIILCAMGGTSPIGFDGKFVERTHAYYVERAKANVGLMIPGVTAVHGMGRSWLYESEALFMGRLKSSWTISTRMAPSFSCSSVPASAARRSSSRAWRR